MKMHQNAQNTTGNNLIRGVFVKDPIFSKSSPKKKTKMDQSTIRNDPMFIL